MLGTPQAVHHLLVQDLLELGICSQSTSFCLKEMCLALTLLWDIGILSLHQVGSRVDTAHTPLAGADQVAVLDMCCCYLCQQCTVLYLSGRFAEPQADGVFLL